MPRKKMLTILRNRKSAAACRSTIVELKAELARCQLELNLRDQIAELLHAPATPVGDGRPLDLSGDGLADAVGYDTNGDGRVDALDTNGDGKIDSKIMVRSCLPAFLLACLPACLLAAGALFRLLPRHDRVCLQPRFRWVQSPHQLPAFCWIVGCLIHLPY